MSIKEIAAIAGTSVSTVSRVLNDPSYKCKKPGVREKIWRVAMELHYTPNEAARNLKLGAGSGGSRIFKVAVLMISENESRTDPIYIELLKVIESEIHGNNCVLSGVIFNNDGKKLDETLSKMEAADGVMIVGKAGGRAVSAIKGRFKNVVSLNLHPAGFEVDEVICDGARIASLAVGYLVSLGHEKIAYVGETKDEPRYDGFKRAMYDLGRAVRENFVINADNSEFGGYGAMSRIFDMTELPTAIYCYSDVIAIGVMRCLSRNRNRIYTPSVMGSNDIDEAQNLSPMLTTVRVPREEMGRMALYLLIEKMKGKHRSRTRVVLEPELMARMSCDRVENSYWSDYII